MKTNEEHTLGPWTVQEEYDGVLPVEGWDEGLGDYVEIARVSLDILEPEQRDANARLIAAAPELLAALEMIQEAFVHKPGDVKGNKARTAPLKYANAEFSAALTAARLAIEKAKGEK
ncbi:MAG: hypothetical protein RQ748_09905 [Elusimicrobiales bacterium]|nr:hypothetical protein [Elusimicrobiales bacterium]